MINDLTFWHISVLAWGRPPCSPRGTIALFSQTLWPFVLLRRRARIKFMIMMMHYCFCSNLLNC